MSERDDDQQVMEPTIKPAKRPASTPAPNGGTGQSTWDHDDDGRGQPDPPVRGTTKPAKLFDAMSEEAKAHEAQEPAPGEQKPS